MFIEENNGHLIKIIAPSQQEQIDHNVEQLQFHLIRTTLHQMKMIIIMMMRMKMMMIEKVVCYLENVFKTVVNFQYAFNIDQQLKHLFLVQC